MDEPIGALQAASDLLRPLASPVRLGIIRKLPKGGKYVHELASTLGVSKPLVSEHLRVLRTSRIVTAQRRVPRDLVRPHRRPRRPHRDGCHPGIAARQLSSCSVSAA
ncbi:ArsR/SmtB family transcription factor [Streptomyces sp. NPDC058424]|uniref:ArsR/SmtB family transcription factor n=1 Tax=Streptomyces sp. NPDC058424 TaxID=3346491 RepID=UPI00366983E3